jgi:TPR repeat protein
MKRPFLMLTVITVLLLSIDAAWAGPFENGEAANQRGDYAEVVKWYQLVAAQGLAKAQSILGAMYDTGRGVAQDYGEAVK